MHQGFGLALSLKNFSLYSIFVSVISFSHFLCVYTYLYACIIRYRQTLTSTHTHVYLYMGILERVCVREKESVYVAKLLIC